MGMIADLFVRGALLYRSSPWAIGRLWSLVRFARPAKSTGEFSYAFFPPGKLKERGGETCSALTVHFVMPETTWGVTV